MGKIVKDELDKIKAKKVDDYLREVDYTELANYRPKEFSLNFVNFIKLINGKDGESNVSPPMHYKMLDTFAYSGASNVVNLCARGIGKTTLFGEYLILYLACFNQLPCIVGDITTIVFLGDSKDNGAKNLRLNIKARLARSEILSTILKAKITEDELEFKNIQTGKVLNVALFGAKSGFRGLKRQGDRPQLAILDDLISDSAATSQIMLKSISETIYSGIIPALDPNPGRSKLIFNGTPFSKSDPIYEAVESGRWEVNVYPICETFPVDEKHFKGAWEERFGYDYILNKYLDLYATGKGASFKKEYMLSISAEEDRLVLDSDIQWYSKNTVLERLINNPNSYTVFITTDFATSDRSTGDFSAILVWAFDYLGNRYLLDGILRRQTMQDNLDVLFRYCSTYKPLLVGIETNGQQGGFISWIKQEQLRRGIYFTFACKQDSNGRPTTIGIPSTANKKARFELSVIQFKNKKVFFPIEDKFSDYLIELQDEISSVTIDGIKSKHDDGIDAVSQLDQFYCPLPSYEDFIATTEPIKHDSHNQNYLGGYFDNSSDIIDQFIIPEHFIENDSDTPTDNYYLGE